jgi:hypothetical protein
VPFGNYKNPDIVNETTLKAVSKYLNESNGVFLSADFEDSLKDIKKGSFVYFDPPYDPVSDSACFTGYTLVVRIVDNVYVFMLLFPSCFVARRLQYPVLRPPRALQAEKITDENIYAINNSNH